MRLNERGFTLIEVMVALSLLSVLLMSGGMFMMRAMFTSSALTGRQGAIAVANQVLEEIRAVDPTFDGEGISPLVYGRTQAAVTAQWNAAAVSGVDLSQTYTGSGTTAYDVETYDPGTHTARLPMTRTITNGSRTFETSILIGACTRSDSGGACTKGTTGALLLRVVALVRWQSGNDGCAASGCSYSSATLVDPSSDPQFNSSRRPVANPDSASTTAGTAVDIPVAFNDSGVFALYGAVSIISGPANGTLSLYSTNNIVQYTPKSGFAGTDTFTYKVVDTSNRVSDLALVTILVSPVALPTSLPTSLPTVLPTVLPTSIGGLLGAGEGR